MVRSAVDVLWIARYDYRKGWELRPHHHAYFQIIHFLKGSGTLRVGDRNFRITGGETALVKPGEVHDLQAESTVCTFDVKFQVSVKALETLLAGAASVFEWNEPGLMARFEKIRQEGEMKRPYYREICSTLLQETLYLYLRQQRPDGAAQRSDPHRPDQIADAPAHDELLQRANDLLRTNPGRQLTVRQMARELGCSDRSLRLHFRRSLGISPLQHLQAFRIAHARSLIEFSDYSLKEIAGLAGFQNVQHFSRVFKQVSNRTPAAWRNENLRGVRKDVVINPLFSNQNWTVQNGAGE